MKTDYEQSADDAKKAELEEALDIWMEMREVDQREGWERLVVDIDKMRSLRKYRLRWKYIRLAAAVVVLLLGAGGIFWLRSEKDTVRLTVASSHKQPRLILENGEQIWLGDQEGKQEKVGKRNFVIDRKEKNIIYTASRSGDEKSLQYNVLEVPCGAEYELILADGTHIWLNAESRLRYPVCFGKGERRVYLEGEAYFEVAKDTAHPFRVESETQVVEVLGTQFNVYAYAQEEQAYTTLVEGRVAVTASVSGRQTELRPGQQASVKGDNGLLRVSEVNIRQVVDWKNGMFVFDDQKLEVILRKVARWYDVEVFYRNQAARSIVFKGNLPRYGELPELLKVLESGSEVHFSLKGTSLVVE